MPPNEGFSPIYDPPKISFQIGLSLLYPCGALTSCKIRKILRAVSEIFKDGPRTDMSDYIGPPLVNPGSKNKSYGAAKKQLNKKNLIITFGEQG